MTFSRTGHFQPAPPVTRRKSDDLAVGGLVLSPVEDGDLVRRDLDVVADRRHEDDEEDDRDEDEEDGNHETWT